MELSVKQTLHVEPEDYQEPHNEGPQSDPALVHQWNFN